MPVLGSIKYPGSTHYDIPDSFLLQSDVDSLVDYAKSFEFDTQISDSAIEVIDNSPGLNTNSFNVDGRAPLNEVSNELVRNMLSSMDAFKTQSDAIKSKGYSHIYNEAAENYLTVLEEYNKRLDKLKEEVSTYNDVDNSTYTYSETDASGNQVTKYGMRATCTLTCDLTSAPTLTFTEGTGPNGNKEATANYSQLIAEYDNCKDFFDTYVTDAIELRDKCDACKEEGAVYSIDKQINDLLNQTSPELTGEVKRGTPRELTGEELEAYLKDNYLHNVPGIKVYCETVNINGVDFNLYQVIDPKDFDQAMYDRYVENSLKYLSAVDPNVLSFIQSNGTELMYLSSFTCSNYSYENGKYVGGGNTQAYSLEETTNLYMIYDPTFMNEYGYSATVHELGHTLDYAIQDKRGREGVFGGLVDNFLDVDFGSDRNYDGEYTYNGKNFYQIASEEMPTVLDPSLAGNSGIPSSAYGTDPNDGDYNHDFSYYKEDQLVEDDDDILGRNDNATEYFAEAFKAYYSLDPERRARYRYLMPETFGYMDQLVNNL